MKRRILINIFLFSIATLNLAAQENCKGYANITTSNDSALIFINDELAGKGNINIELPPANYKILVLESDKEWGSGVIEDSILIDECEQSITRNYSFSKKTLITSLPSAAVISNDSILGYTPLSLAMKYNSVMLSKTGYSPKQIRLNNVPIQSKVKLEFIGMEKEEPFIETALFKVLVGGVVALGATAAYFKLKADDNFDKYLETRQSSYLDNTDTYDLYSGIAFGALQLNFGALLYFFLID